MNLCIVFVAILHLNLLAPVSATLYIEHRFRETTRHVNRYDIWSEYFSSPQKVRGSRRGYKPRQTEPLVVQLYECTAGPDVKLQLKCGLVNDPVKMDNIYSTANFYYTYHPKLMDGWLISFVGVIRDELPTDLGVGLIPEKHDAPPLKSLSFYTEGDEIQGYLADLVPMFIAEDGCVQKIKYLAMFFMINNFEAFNEKSSDIFLSAFKMYRDTLEAIIRAHKNDLVNSLNDSLDPKFLTEKKLKEIVTFFLYKMVDPCTLLKKPLADTYCHTYCKYLDVASELLGFSFTFNQGSCVRRVCMCRKMSWLECGWAVKRSMLYCNNLFRLHLNSPVLQ